MILGGLSSVLLGCVLFAAPLLSGLLLTRIVGTIAAIGGVMLIVLAMRLRRGVKLAARF
jgi:uncharacterized membrane protein HdeD (DUF308 family)